MNETRQRQVLGALDLVRPYIRGDGGDVELLDIDDAGIVTIRLTGNCVGCGSVSVTVNEGILTALQASCSWVRGVELREGGDADASPSASTSATSSLEDEHREAEALLEELDNEMLELTAHAELPPSVARWTNFARQTLRPHFEAEEASVFPAAEIFLGSVAAPLQKLREDHARFWELLALFESAVAAFQDKRNAAALADLMESGRAMSRHLTTHFLREQGGLYAMIDQGLPDDIKREVREDIHNVKRRRIAAFR